MISGGGTPRARPRAQHVGRLTRFAALLLAAMLVNFGRPAGAQDELAVTSRAQITVSSMSAVLGPGSVTPVDPAIADAPEPPDPRLDLELRVLVENIGEESLDQLRLVVEFFAAVEQRADLHAALDGEPAQAVLRVHDQTIRDGAALAFGDIAGMRVRLTPDELPWSPDGGVHPVRVSVVRGTEVLDSVATAAVWLARSPAAPVRTLVVWPIDAPPTRSIGSVYAASSDREFRPGGRLDGLLGSLERNGSSVVLAPAAHLLEELRDRANGFFQHDLQDDSIREIQPEDPEARLANDALQRIRELVRGSDHPPVSSSYARADLDALLDIDDGALRDVAATAAADGARRLAVILDAEPDAATHLLDGPATPEALDLLPAARIIVPHTALADADVRDLPAGEEPVRPLRTSAGRVLTAMVADRFLSESLSSPDLRAGAPIAIQRIVASTAAAMLDDPETPHRTLVIVPDARWDPTPRVAGGVLEGLRSANWVDLVGPPTVVGTSRRAARPVVLARPDAAFDPGFADALADASGRLSAARDALPDGETTIAGFAPAELDDAIMQASSSWHRRTSQRLANVQVSSVRNAVDEAFGVIQVGESRVTLTSDTGQIPITLERSSGGPITVRVEVESHGRLVWPDGDQSEVLVLEPETRHTVSFTAHALSTGTFPVTVRVTDPDGRFELAGATLPVRSTALSRPALLVTASVIIVLLLFGAFRRTKPRLQVVTPDRSSEQDG